MNQIQVELQGTFGSDRQIAEAAWTSSTSYQGKKKRSSEDVEKVVRMLIQQKHSVPIESVVFRFWMKVPIQTDRQIVTHRIASHSGMSGRYRTMPNEYLDLPEDVENIINKFPCLTGDSANPTKLDLFEQYYNICESANELYRASLNSAKEAEKAGTITNQEYKRFREFYRGILPQNNMTERVTIMNLRSFANFVKLRNSEYAQPEIRHVAQLMLDEVKKSGVCPVALDELEKNGWNI